MRCCWPSGGRADSGAVRHGAERAEVSATFAVADNAAALAWLDEQSIAHDGECQLRRVVGVDGRGRAYLNGQSVPVQSLRALGELLVDVHGQLEFQSLSRKGYQRATLDGSGKLGALVAAVRAAYAHLARGRRGASVVRAALARSRRSPRPAAALRDRARMRSIPKPQEAESLDDERRRIASMGRLAEGTAQVEALLAGEDGGVVAALARAQSVCGNWHARRETGADRAVARGGQYRVLARRSAACVTTSMRSRRTPRGRNGSRPGWRRSKRSRASIAKRSHNCPPCASVSQPSLANSNRVR